MTTLAFLQARVGSTRLPGKVLEPIEGVPMVLRIVERLGQTTGLDGVLVVTTDRPADEPLRKLLGDAGVPWFAGSEDDVLDRFATAARQERPDRILRVTADCPLTDPAVLGDLLAFAAAGGYDHAANATGAFDANAGFRRFPHGLDAEVVPTAALLAADREARDPFEREHVTPFIWRRPDRFKLGVHEAAEDHGAERWTVDHPADMEFVRKVYAELGADSGFRMNDVLELLARRPELRELNRAEQAGYQPVRDA